MRENRGPLLFIDSDSLITTMDKNIDKGFINFQASVFRGLSSIVDKSNFNLVMLLDGDELLEAGYAEEKIAFLCNKIRGYFANEKIFFTDCIIDYKTQKLNPKFVYDRLKTKGYLDGDYDFNYSFIIADKVEDFVLAEHLNINSILYSSSKENSLPNLALATDDWAEISNFLVDSGLRTSRKANIVRETNETKIKLDINLDGTGKANINTNIKFFDHMLEQIARHSDIDIDLVCDGDIEVDEHHSVEDVGIALGNAINSAIGDKKGLTRYGFNNLVMDEVLAQGSIDFSNRPYLVYDVPITREYIGTFPTEMFEHFFKSFSDASGATLHLQASKGNAHHMIEAVYKSFAKCLKQALYVYPFSNKLPTTKGLL